MATRATELEHIRREIESLKKQVARLERRKNGKRRATTRKRQAVASERERAREILREAGLLAELTPQEKAMAAEWRALPEEEKQRVNQELWNLKLEKPLSQIIIENR
ncbi:MAG: hypothetical protein KGJ80_00445 [Chloroflexota bacterium]|nr:hypothetical protein [Chloroflexota bacterium]